MGETSTASEQRSARRLAVTDLDRRALSGQRALVRVDFNVPLSEQDGEMTVASDARIRAALPTIEWLGHHGARVILVSHLGRPAGERVADLSLRPVARRLKELLGRQVVFLPNLERDALRLVRGGEGVDVVLLENIRYEAGETKNDPVLADRLAQFGQLFVQDAFGTCHRAHASTVGVAERLSPSVAGTVVARELAAFERLTPPARPFVAILGGAKIAGKLDVIDALAGSCDRICLGGGMANTFLAAAGTEIGDSLFEPDRLDAARRLLAEHGDKLLLPVDAVVASELSSESPRSTIDLGAVDAEKKILDIGPRSVTAIARELGRARTIFWNGPLGVFEIPPFDVGTVEVARRLGAVTRSGAFSIAGGGDSIAALERAGEIGAISHVSTGGGAALELVAGKHLPGIEVLDPYPRGGGF